MTSEPSVEINLHPGNRYGEFEIVRPLGKGAFARVFEARSPNFAEPVALKLSRAPLTTEALAIRALREIRILQNLRNPYVVHILDHGVGEDERWYMVMGLLRGATLLEHHDFDQPMDPLPATKLVYEACAGLDEAHELGIVHRDIKPENLWVCEGTGMAKVIDFGLARAWNPGSTIGTNATVGHMLIGTPHYAQPEQIHSGELVPASDIYSLGVVFYELLSGRMPLFPDEPLNALRRRLLRKPLGWLGAHVKADVVDIEHYPEGRRLPLALREVVHAMLAKQPDQRPPRGSAVAKQLAEILHDHYGVRVAGRLRIVEAGGREVREVLAPGLHRVGVGDEVSIWTGHDGPPRIEATLHWLGPGHEAVLTPVGPAGKVSANGFAVEAPVRLVPGTTFEVGGATMQLEYPDSTGAK